MTDLTGQEKRRLRSQGQTLTPCFTIGKAGLTDAAFELLDNQFQHRQLLKVRLPAVDRQQRKQLAESLAEQSGSTVVGAIGRNILLYRPQATTEQGDAPHL
ncbi:MAG: YhbY family RNA-binding protein [Phycisphaerae bacterium]